MDYSNITPEVKAFFISEYSKNANELRVKASNPRARKAAEFNAQAEEFEAIVASLKAS